MYLLVCALALGQMPPPSPPPHDNSSGLKIVEVHSPERPKPQEISARVGELKRLASGDEKAKWELAAGTTGAEVIPDGKGGCVFSAERQGKYTLVCYVEGPCAWVVVTVGEGSPDPVPVPPQPDPAPVPPPVPPTPPVPPKPLSPLAESLLTAITKDGGYAANKEAIEQLQALVSVGIEELAKPETRFSDELAEALRKAGAVLARDRAPATRVWLNEQFRATFGTTRYFLTDDKRKEIADKLAVIHSAFREIEAR